MAMPADIPVSAFDRDSVNVEAPWMTRKESGLRFSGSTSSRNRDRALTGLGVIAGLVVSNAATLRYIEGWSWVRSFYFTIITATTVGYGDISPATTAGRWVTIVFIWLSIVLISFCCGSFFAYYGDLTEQALEHAIADTVGAVDEGGGEREKTAAVRTKKTEQDSLLRSTARTLAVCFLRIGVCTATGGGVFAYSGAPAPPLLALQHTQHFVGTMPADCCPPPGGWARGLELRERPVLHHLHRHDRRIRRLHNVPGVLRAGPDGRHHGLLHVLRLHR